MASKAKKPTPMPKPPLAPTPPPEPIEVLEAAAEDEDPTEEVEFTPEPEPMVEPTPSGFQQEPEEVREESPAASVEPLGPGETVILNGPASYGPVIIDGHATRCYKGKPVRVPDPNERLIILGTGRFRLATDKDVREAKVPSAGRGGAITKDLLPPGAIKGGLTQR